MTRELRVAVSEVPVERARADLAVVPLFARERPLRGGVGRADWRLCGKLSSLLARGRLEGARGEATLLASFGGVRAPLLLVIGVGERRAFDAAGFGGLVAEAVGRAIGLRAERLALPLPEERGLTEDLAPVLLTAAADAVAAASGPVTLELELLAEPGEGTRTLDLLRRARPSRFPAGVALRLRAASDGRRRAEREAEAAPPRGQPLVK